MTKHAPSQVPMLIGDVLRVVVDIVVHSLALLAAVIVFLSLWDLGSLWARLLAFPAAYATLAVSFPLIVMAIGLVFVRRITPGTYNIRKREAVRWIVGVSLMLMVRRSFLRGYLEDFNPQRYLFYRLMGARIDRTFFLGEKATISDPWVLKVGSNVVIGAFSVILGHTVEGDELIVKPVVIRDGATVGMRSVILPGVEIGANAVVGAGALVTKDTVIAAGEIWGGVPARKIGVVQERPGHDAGQADGQRP